MFYLILYVYVIRIIFYSILNSLNLFFYQNILLFSLIINILLCAIYLGYKYVHYFCLLPVIINCHKLLVLNYYVVIIFLVIYVKCIFYNLDYYKYSLKKRMQGGGNE